MLALSVCVVGSPHGGVGWWSRRQHAAGGHRGDRVDVGPARLRLARAARRSRRQPGTVVRLVRAAVPARLGGRRGDPRAGPHPAHGRLPRHRRRRRLRAVQLRRRSARLRREPAGPPTDEPTTVIDPTTIDLTLSARHDRPHVSIDPAPRSDASPPVVGPTRSRPVVARAVAVPLAHRPRLGSSGTSALWSTRYRI